MTESNYTELIEQIESLKREKAEAVGARDELLKQLKEEFGVSSVEEANEKIASLERRAAVLEKKRDREYSKLKKSPVWRKINAGKDRHKNTGE